MKQYVSRMVQGIVGKERYLSFRRNLSNRYARIAKQRYTYYEPENRSKYLDDIYELRLENIVPIDQPMVLISQAVRSGGTLMNRLFDMHPNCHVHPHETLIGYPERTVWPQFDLDNPDSELWFRQLFEQSILRMLDRGYGSRIPEQRNPFLFVPPLQREIFELTLGDTPSSQRDIFNAYMTAYFNAWLDNHNLYTTPKKYVVGFTPRLSSNPESIPRFFQTYEDGRFISIMRDPRDWFASARFRYNPRWDAPLDKAPEGGWPLEDSMHGGWLASAQAAANMKQQYPDQVYILAFEDILRDTEATMRGITEWLGIDFADSMLRPSFNSMATTSNSTYELRTEINTKPIGRYKEKLSQQEIEQIEEMVLDLYYELTERSS